MVFHFNIYFFFLFYHFKIPHLNSWVKCFVVIVGSPVHIIYHVSLTPSCECAHELISMNGMTCTERMFLVIFHTDASSLPLPHKQYPNTSADICIMHQIFVLLSTLGFLLLFSLAFLSDIWIMYHFGLLQIFNPLYPLHMCAYVE